MSKYTENIFDIINSIKKGEVIIYPTDTILGLGCDATNDSAVDKLQDIKARDAKNGMIILLDSDNRLNKYVKKVPDIAWDLFETAIEPLTLILPDGINVSPKILANDGSIAIRIVKDGICHELLRKFQKPLTSTSVNLSGENPAINYSDINPKIIESVDAILLSETIFKSKASSIIKINIDNTIQIIRK